MLLCFTQTCHSEKCNSRSKQTTLSKSQSVLPKQISHTNHKFCATIIAGIIGRSGHKYHFCHDNFFVATSLLLSQQTRVCSNKRRHLFTTKVCLLRQISVTMNTNTSICCEKSYVIIKIFCHDKHNFVATKVLSRQAFFFFHQRTCMCLSRQNFCCNKNDTCDSSSQWYAGRDSHNSPCRKLQEDSDKCAHEWSWTTASWQHCPRQTVKKYIWKIATCLDQSILLATVFHSILWIVKMKTFFILFLIQGLIIIITKVFIYPETLF